MRSTGAIFRKQAQDLFRNRMMLIQFVIFPIMAFVLTEFVAKADSEIPNSMFITMFAAMFAGMTPLVMTSGAISEDRERNSLRFLMMAGVRPHEYLIGISGFTFLACSLVSVLFGVIGGFVNIELVKFSSILVLGSCASILLGASIGLLAKNQQAATAVSTPVFMILSFSPLVAQFNEDFAELTKYLYTQQINTVINNLTDNITDSILIVITNIAVLLVLFILAYKKCKLNG